TLLGHREFLAASEVFATHLRILFAVSMVGTCTLVFLVGPITSLLGSQYRGDTGPFVLLIVLNGVATPGTAGGTLLSSMGKQQRSVWIGLVQVALLVLSFAVLWPRYNLLG